MKTKTEIKTVTLTTLPACSICEVEFPHATPNPAAWDGQISGSLGLWGYACTAHKSHLAKGMISKIVKG